MLSEFFTRHYLEITELHYLEITELVVVCNGHTGNDKGLVHINPATVETQNNL